MKKGISQGHNGTKENTGREERGDFQTKISFNNVPFIMNSPKLTAKNKTKTKGKTPAYSSS